MGLITRINFPIQVHDLILNNAHLIYSRNCYFCLSFLSLNLCKHSFVRKYTRKISLFVFVFRPFSDVRFLCLNGIFVNRVFLSIVFCRLGCEINWTKKFDFDCIGNLQVPDEFWNFSRWNEISINTIGSISTHIYIYIPVLIKNKTDHLIRRKRRQLTLTVKWNKTKSSQFQKLGQNSIHSKEIPSNSVEEYSVSYKCFLLWISL